MQLPHNHEHSVNFDPDTMPKTQDFQVVSEMFKQLDDSSRIRIFWLLCHGEECVINISALMEMSSPAVSHHLNRLKANGLITSYRKGKEVYYKAAQTPQTNLLHETIEKLVQISCPMK